ncbi:unnamed protein product [Spirodela intermedia]|uniref:FAD-binding FR-type domain-containing protein n=1 Tax=Spirodela intermedia TaxID=51605 RepID=A0A7I8IH94_SPIIN|nr:unnamed protein product [Spirodela intermedia]CAA6657162.1 unnamed protein product [Spirodela intermedia]
MANKVERRSSELSMAGVVRLLAVAIFLGYILAWVIAPTNRYREKWQPKLRADTNSTYFGTQGTNLLIYTFPILFISILGCVYIHLKKGRREDERHALNLTSLCQTYRNQMTGSCERSLGIVSWTELAFLAMFVALLTWYFSVYLSNSFSRITPQSAAKAGEKVWEAKLESAALRLGLLGNLCLAFLFIPVTRTSSILPLAGLTSEGSIKYHIWLGTPSWSSLPFTAYCTLSTGQQKFMAIRRRFHEQMLEWANTGESYVAGELALLCGLVLWATTLQRVRRKMFELFFYSHQLYVFFLFFFLLHVGIGFFCLILPGVYLFMIDRFLRFLQSRGRVRLVSARLLPGDSIELNFAKSPSLEYNPLSNVFVNVPAVSRLQWHPFTVSSNSNLEPDTLSVIIKKEGSWTQKLHQVLASSPPERLEVALEGPYGPVSNSFSRYNSLVLISGGSGITPFISIIREFIFRSATGEGATPKIHLICAFKNSADLTMLDLLLPFRAASPTSPGEGPTGKGDAVRTLWFKPRPTDQPAAAVLGPHSWLLLAAVIASSFVAFLLLIGIMNRYYIYPKDHNTNKVYSYTAKALLNLLIICATIAATAAAAFLWGKQRHAAEGRQVQIANAPTPAGQELESLPQESLVRSTNVQFGARPDLKNPVGAGGEGRRCPGQRPRGMRRDVAKICSSGLTDNLHYESMSFSW